MKAQRDDMADHIYPQGARETTAARISANNVEEGGHGGGYIGHSRGRRLAATSSMKTTKAASSGHSSQCPVTTKPGNKLQLPANRCAGTKPTTEFDDHDCTKAALAEQAGADVTKGVKGTMVTLKSDGTPLKPITKPLGAAGMCPVNVHWHSGAEHRSTGQYDESGQGYMEYKTEADKKGRSLAGAGRRGNQCHLFDKTDPKFTTEYDWKHCKDMHVGETYEVHWPHSAFGACGTPDQYQTSFYDGVFCNFGHPSLNFTLPPGGRFPPREAVAASIGVQAQVFVVVNDEGYYYPDLMRGMLVDGDFGKDMAFYTGSTTGDKRNNNKCSSYSPITWQVDRKCHMISASTFDKMCADMKAQRDDMSDDLYAHGSRTLVSDQLTANNQANRKPRASA